MKLFFLDFEASSLDRGSFPIEIGWVGANGQGESYLIQPHWSWQGWSAESEQVHHITRDMLKAGTDAITVARRAHKVLNDAIVVSDQPAFEQYWLGMLLGLIDAQPIRCFDIHAVIGQEIKRVQSSIKAVADSPEWQRQSRILLDEAQIAAMSAYEGATMSITTRHRALADAEALWRGWRAVILAIDQICDRVD